MDGINYNIENAIDGKISNLNNQRTNGAAAGASKDSSLMFGGGNASGSVDFVESYNGGTWTEVADLNQHRQNIAGAGVQTSALAFGGLSNPPVVMRALTESWNGSGWTEVGDLNTTRRGLGVNGSPTATIAFGGFTPSPSAVVANTELWNGASWLETSDLNTAAQSSGKLGTGTTSSAIKMGGSLPAITATTEEWSGTSNLTKTIDTD